jgi:hypothetical protein
MRLDVLLDNFVGVGLGAQPPTPALGTMVASGTRHFPDSGLHSAARAVLLALRGERWRGSLPR